MEELGKQQVLVPASTVAIAICTSSGPQAPSEFVAVMKVVVAVLAIGVTLCTLYLSLRLIRGAAPNQQPMQKSGKRLEIHNIYIYTMFKYCACVFTS